MHRYRTPLALFIASLSTAIPADPQAGFAAADAKILAEIRDHSEAIANIEYLCDRIGPRVTGSAQQREASEWTAQKLREYGLSNVRLEPWSIAHSWTRGIARARILTPVSRTLTIAAAGWSPRTDGTVRGRVVYVAAKDLPGLQSYRGKLKGSVVIYQEPAHLGLPEKDSPPLPGVLQNPDPPAAPRSSPDLFSARAALFRSEGVAAILLDSGLPYGLLEMGNGTETRYEPGAVPMAFLTHEDYFLLWRLLKHGGVELEIEMTNSFSDGPVETHNTSAEIRGSEKPDELVIVGAHLDSWDLGTGATDDGAGSIAVLEAARALLDLRPRRTIRFVLFTGEEQGLAGSRQYVQAHRQELGKISAMLAHDTGTGRILTIAMHHHYEDRELMDRVLAPLESLKILEPKMAKSGGSDYASFNEVGLPGFSCIGDQADYSLTHHTQADTLDKVREDGLTQAAQFVAAWAYNTAQLDQMLPRPAGR